MKRNLWLMPMLLLVRAAAAQEAPAAEPPGSASASEDVPFLDELPPAAGDEQPAGPALDEEPAGEEGQAQEDAPTAPAPRRTGPTPQRFEPSEEVRADFPVSFPIDI